MALDPALIYILYYDQKLLVLRPWCSLAAANGPRADTQLVPYGSRPSHLLGLQLRSTMELLPGHGNWAIDGFRRLGA